MISKNLTGTGVKSKYTGVFYCWNGAEKKNQWSMQCGFQGKKAQRRFDFTDEGERLAAIAYDKARLINGLDPVNILKRKLCGEH